VSTYLVIFREASLPYIKKRARGVGAEVEVVSKFQNFKETTGGLEFDDWFRLYRTGWTRSKQDQRRGYQLWATSLCCSGTELAMRVETKYDFKLNLETKQTARSPRSF